jgi:glutathione S-transferase
MLTECSMVPWPDFVFSTVSNPVLAPNLNRGPVLIYKGTSIGQSKTIERFVAKKLGFAGSDELEEAAIDCLCEHIRDVKLDYTKARMGKTEGEELEKAKKEWLETGLKTWMEKLEPTLTGSNGFAVGSKLSLADIQLQQLILDFFDDKAAAEAACVNSPKVLKSAKLAHEASKEWMAKRPVTKN